MNTATNQRGRFFKLGTALLKRINDLTSPIVSKTTQQITLTQKLQLQSILDDIVTRPADYRIHFKLAEYYFSIGRFIPAIAECRSSLALGNENPEAHDLLGEVYVAAGFSSLAEALFTRGFISAEYLRKLQEKYGDDTDGLVRLSPLIYQRLRAIKRRINQVTPDPDVRILDVGGGEGQLCLLMPNANYVLAEPTINGIAGQSTGFAEKFFDVVVACHVVEHIPDVYRENFLKVLCSLARTRVILLVPIADDGYAIKADALIYRITQAPWAREHLNCELPSLKMLREFANKQGLECNVMPNGDRAAVFWMIFAMHYANLAGKAKEVQEIVHSSSRYLDDSLPNPNQPNDYFIEFRVDKSTAAQI